MALTRRVRPRMADAVAAPEPTKPARRVRATPSEPVRDRPEGDRKRVYSTADAGRAPDTLIQWEATKRSVADHKARMVEREKTRFLLTEDAAESVRQVREEADDPRPVPTMHPDLLPSTLYVGHGDTLNPEVNGFVTFAGANDRFAIGWDICGQCMKHVIRCTCKYGSVPPMFIREMVRQMSDEEWPSSKERYTGNVIGWDHDPDNPGRTLPMFFESPAKPWKGRPGTKRPTDRKRLPTARTAAPTAPRKAVRKAPAVTPAPILRPRRRKPTK